MRGTVLQVGPGLTNLFEVEQPDGSTTVKVVYTPVGFEPGDRVILPKYEGEMIDVADCEITFIRAPMVIAKIGEENDYAEKMRNEIAMQMQVEEQEQLEKSKLTEEVAS